MPLLLLLLLLPGLLLFLLLLPFGFQSPPAVAVASIKHDDPGAANTHLTANTQATSGVPLGGEASSGGIYRVCVPLRSGVGACVLRGS
mmetsp:Transcript_29315/g.72534  ORF Transcript_29315/g.72534 Transcript_29315/m.72534 type:complete len:88 (-) Transcript_29315:55-318(-)